MPAGANAYSVNQAAWVCAMAPPPMGTKAASSMSASGTLQTSISMLDMSAFGCKADSHDPRSNVR